MKVDALDRAGYQRMLSVIVPIYNAAAFLPRCLESLIGLTYRDLEIICVDDGSTDASGTILDEFAARDSRIKVIHQKNAGVSAARNAGLDAATGEYVTFVDADDWVERDAYEMALSVFTPKVDLVCYGTVVDGAAPAELEAYCNLIPEGSAVADPGRLRSMNASLWDKVYRNSLIKNYHLHFPSGVAYGEDMAFFYCYAAVMEGEMYGIPRKWYHYVQNEYSAMANPAIGEKRAASLWHAFRFVHAFYARQDVLPRMQPVLEMLFYSLFYFAKEGGRMHEMLPQLVEAARMSEVLYSSRSQQVLEIRMLQMSALERMFHWFTGNRECYGIAGRSFFSITYEPEQWIYRCMGRRVRTVRKR